MKNFLFVVAAIAAILFAYVLVAALEMRAESPAPIRVAPVCDAFKKNLESCMPQVHEKTKKAKRWA